MNGVLGIVGTTFMVGAIILLILLIQNPLKLLFLLFLHIQLFFKSLVLVFGFL